MIGSEPRRPLMNVRLTRLNVTSHLSSSLNHEKNAVIDPSSSSKSRTSSGSGGRIAPYSKLSLFAPVCSTISSKYGLVCMAWKFSISHVTKSALGKKGRKCLMVVPFQTDCHWLQASLLEPQTSHTPARTRDKTVRKER